MADFDVQHMSGYRDTYVSDQAVVIQGDVYGGFERIIVHHDSSLAKDDVLRGFASTNVAIVEQFVQRMHALRQSLDQDSQAKSRALQNVGGDTDRLNRRMRQYNNELTEARQHSATSDNIAANVQILSAMGKILEEALDSLASSLSTFKDEADRQEKARVLQEIEDSRKNVQNMVAVGNDTLTLVTMVPIPINNPHLRKTQNTVNQVSGKLGFANSMFDRLKTLAGKDKQDDPSTTRSEGHHFESRHNRSDRQSQCQPHSNTRALPTVKRQTNFTYDEEDRPENRPSLPARPGSGWDIGASSSTSGHGGKCSEMPSLRRTITLPEPNTRAEILGPDWQPKQVPFQPPPSRSAARSTTPSLISGLNKSITSSPALPPRAPQQPPRPSATSRTFSETSTLGEADRTPQSRQTPAKRPPPPSPKPSHLLSRTTSKPKSQSPPSTSSPLLRHPSLQPQENDTIASFSPRSSSTLSRSPASFSSFATSMASSSTPCSSPPQKKAMLTDGDDLTFQQKQHMFTGLITNRS